MKTIGLIGGMSWESTLPYYRLINQGIARQLGGFHSAKIVLYSVDFAEIEALQRVGDWDRSGEVLADATRRLKAAGADFVVLCTNTMHKVADAIEGATDLALLHIADPTAQAIRAAGFHTIGLLGTRFTMEQAFYRERLASHGIQALVPEQDDRDNVHRIIYDELVKGVVEDDSRAECREVIARLVERGAQAIILGCTELSLLIGEPDSAVPLFDTTALHAQAVVAHALVE